MTRAQIRASLDLWERRETRAHVNHLAARDRGDTTRERLWVERERHAEKMIRRRRKQLLVEAPEPPATTATWRPQIIGWDRTGIKPRNVFGALGDETKLTTHYAASPRARNLEEGVRLTRQFDQFHASKGWGGCSYTWLIPDTGELILGRSTYHRGAHVANTNTGNVGVNFFCTLGDEPTVPQALTYLWVRANAHTDALPEQHRTDRDLRSATERQHQDWPGQSTSCAGLFTPSNLRRIAA